MSFRSFFARCARHRFRPAKLLRADNFRRFLRNASYLSNGSVVASVFALTTLIFVGRALGPELLGVLALIEAYVRLIDTTVRLELREAVIKFGADALQRDRHQDFERLVKFELLIDLGGVALAARPPPVARTSSARSWAGVLKRFGPKIYSWVLLFACRRCPTAVLRLFDRFASSPRSK